MNDGPLIVQSDKTLLLEVDHPNAEAARRAIAPFAELERAPEHVHTYRITPLALWNAHAAGHYMLAGDFFENQQKYHEICALLEQPNKFQIYKKTVIDRPSFQAARCQGQDASIFPDQKLYE